MTDRAQLTARLIRQLRDARIAAGYTQLQLCHALDVGDSAVGRWESGGRMYLDAFVAAADQCGADVVLVPRERA